jgi:hypothetical protein
MLSSSTFSFRSLNIDSSLLDDKKAEIHDTLVVAVNPMGQQTF